MKPTPVLIKALRKVASDLRQGAIYSWQNSARCNCGLLAQAITGMSVHDLAIATLHWSGPWTSKVKCMSTGCLLHDIVQELMAAGVEPEDFERIEYLDRGWHDCPGQGEYWQQRENVIRWMEAEADRLEAQLAPVSALVVPPAPTTSTATTHVLWAPPKPYEHTDPRRAAPCPGPASHPVLR